MRIVCGLKPRLPATAQRWLLPAALAYLLFVAYGSLVPLVFHPRLLDPA